MTKDDTYEVLFNIGLFGMIMALLGPAVRRKYQHFPMHRIQRDPTGVFRPVGGHGRFGYKERWGAGNEGTHPQGSRFRAWGGGVHVAPCPRVDAFGFLG